MYVPARLAVPGSASSWSRKARDPLTGHCLSSRRHEPAMQNDLGERARCAPSNSRSVPARKRGTWCSAICSVEGRRRHSIERWRPDLAVKQELLLHGQFGKMVANHPPDLVPIPIGEVVGKTKTVPLDYDLLLTAPISGVSFGD